MASIRRDYCSTDTVQVTASEVLPEGLEIGVKDGRISCIGIGLPCSPGTRVIDAEGAYITPGGVDSHVHLAQKNAPTGDGWETGSRFVSRGLEAGVRHLLIYPTIYRSAVAGGTTTIIAFASQERDDTSLYPVLRDYYAKSKDQSYCDYGFHFILTNPTKEILQNELPALAKDEGVTSVKLYMTYDAMKLDDRQVLDVLFACKALGFTTSKHTDG